MSEPDASSQTRPPSPGGGAGADADWDLTGYFDSFDGREYRAFRDTLAADAGALLGEFGELGDLRMDNLERWKTLLLRLEDANARSAHLGSYLGCLGAADARHEGVRAETAALSVLQSEMRKVFVLVRAALGGATQADFDSLVADERLAPVAWFLARLRRRATWAMAPALEALSAELDTTGLSAWGRLYDQVSGTLEFDLEVSGQPAKRLPVSMTRSLLEDPDPAVREAALIGSNRAWEGVADTVAACLNAISGTRLLLCRRQEVPHFLDPALFDASISRRTLDTMLDTVRARFELPRSYLRRKAELLGKDRLGFQDLMAPLPFESQQRISYDDARGRVLRAFEAFHPELSSFAERAFQGHWIDWSPRTGKRPGGFCSSSPVLGESRIFMTYQGALGDVATLAHELGHAFHSWVMRDMRPWARRYPMTLAETASTFAEQLIVDAVLSDPAASAQERATLLDGRMQDAAAYLLNIPMRFLFEKALYEEREAGEVSVSRMRQLMLDAQRECYGDALADDALDPWFWASKLHFYITGLSFYNFPYTFGYLFSLGIVARAREAGRDFIGPYAELLRLTGSDSAEGVAKRALGVDLEAPAFWNASLDGIESDQRRFEEATRGLF